MSPKVRDTLYLVLLFVNATLTAAVAQNMLPMSWAHYTALASFVLASLMKQFNSKDPVPPTP